MKLHKVLNLIFEEIDKENFLDESTKLLVKSILLDVFFSIKNDKCEAIHQRVQQLNIAIDGLNLINYN